MAALLLLALSACSPDEIPVGALIFGDHAPQNLLVIGIDTLRRDRVGRYTGGDGTPALDALLDASVALDCHHSCSNWTISSTLCFASGRSQLELGFAPYEAGPYPERISLLPDRLGAAGYATALVSANSFVGPSTEYDRRFDSAVLVTTKRAEDVNEAARQQLSGLLTQSAPWLLQVHYVDPHYPYSPPEPWLEGLEALEPLSFDIDDSAQWTAAMADWEALSPEEQALLMAHVELRYQAELAYLDAALAELLAALRETPGALEDTLVILWSDHGEQFMEHGHYWHGRGLYQEEGAAVAALWTLPASAGGPGLAPGSWDGPTTHADLYTTALAALQLEADAGASGVLLGEGDPERALTALRFQGDHPEGSLNTVQVGDRWLGFTWSGELELYDLAADPEQRQDRYDPDDPDARALWELLEPEILGLAELTGVESPI
jgi:arylsulfatase A-like enzyme